MPRVRLEEETDEVCDLCEKPMVIKTGRFGRFMACTGFPDCRNTKPILNKTGVKCPKCSGEVVERKARGRGRPFWGCSNYPNCDFIINRRPLPTPCPECGGMMVQQGRNNTACTSCSWQEAVLDGMEDEGAAEEEAEELTQVGS